MRVNRNPNQNPYCATSIVAARTVAQRFLIRSGAGNESDSTLSIAWKNLTVNLMSVYSIKALKEQSRVRCLLSRDLPQSWRDGCSSSSPGCFADGPELLEKPCGSGMCLERGVLALDRRMDLAPWCLHLPSLCCCGPGEHHLLSKRQVTESSLVQPHGTALRPHVAHCLRYGNNC